MNTIDEMNTDVSADSAVITRNDTIAPLDYGIITSIDDYRNKRNRLFKQSARTGKQFNQFVRATVRYFYLQGNKNIALINDLLRIAHSSKSFDKARLGAYLKAVIPHIYTKDGVKGECPVFVGKKEKTEYDWESVELFLSVHLDWNSYGTEKTAASFEAARYTLRVVQTLRREKIDVVSFAEALISNEISRRTKEEEKARASASR